MPTRRELVGALTEIVGKSTFGRSLTGSVKYAITPKMLTANISRVVATARRMKNSVKFI